MKTAYLGPEGTFTHQAALKINDSKNLIPINSIWGVFENVDNQNIESGIVPIENLIEGTVNITVDSIIFDTSLYIQSQIIIPIEQCLIMKKGSDIKKIEKVLSHPQAIAQCRRYLRNKFPDASLVNMNSTSEAAREVSKSDGSCVSVGMKDSAKMYDLEVFEENIQDNKNNYTDFIVISKNNSFCFKPGNKTSLAFSTLNEPGMLYRLLDIFAIWDLNMTKIVSRPMRNRSGEYVFFIDLEGNNCDKDLNDAIKMIKRKTSFFKILGSYPVIDYRIKK